MTSSKKLTKKKSTKKSPPRPLTWKFYAVTIGIFIVSIGSIVVIALLTSYAVMAQVQRDRLSRINNVYDTINVGNAYEPTYSNIFADKRPYQWDNSRTYSSEVKYVHGDTVSNTVADLDAKIKAAGFEFVDEPYPDSTTTQFHYKSSDNIYVRLSVSSKPYDDAIQNAFIMRRDVPQSVYDMDKNAAPSNVVLKVNLDDNNE